VAHQNPEDGPHLVYLPERAFNIDNFVMDVKTMNDRFGRCLVAVSEGIQDEAGVPILTKLMPTERDAHGNVQLSGTGALGEQLARQVKEKLGLSRVRSDTLGYLQRSFIGCVSDVDQREAREVGEKAAQFAIWHNVDGSIVIERTGNYDVNYRLVNLEQIAAKTKLMPDNFINKEGNNVTEDFVHYLRPLLGSEMPEAARLRAPLVPRIHTR